MPVIEWRCIRSLGLLAAGACVLMVHTASAGVPPPIRRAPGEQVEGIGYSVRFPTEAGWLQAPGPATATAFVRQGRPDPATLSLQVNLMPLPPGAADEAGFRAFIAAEFVDQGDARFTSDVQSVEVRRHAHEPVWCADIDMRILQQDAVVRPGQTAPMTIQIASLLCQHPGDASVGVMVGASLRSPSTASDDTLRAQLASFLIGFQFMPLPERP